MLSHARVGALPHQMQMAGACPGHPSEMSDFQTSVFGAVNRDQPNLAAVAIAAVLVTKAVCLVIGPCLQSAVLANGPDIEPVTFDGGGRSPRLNLRAETRQ